MEVTNFLLNLTSEDPERMKAFYADVVGLPPEPGFGPNAFRAATTVLSFDSHSEIKGPAKEPQRVLINFFVGDLRAEQARLEAKGVKFIRSAGQEEWGGYISTFLDPDGNYLQLVEHKPQ